jgi:hypothetical protein
MRDLAAELRSLGYPGFAHLSTEVTPDPTEFLLTAIAQQDLDVRVIEGLPWVILKRLDLQWEQLIQQAQARRVQNRLGYLVHLAREVGDDPALADHERSLAAVRIDAEDTLCENLTLAERNWLRRFRPAGAAQWRLLTGLTAVHLRYAA